MKKFVIFFLVLFVFAIGCKKGAQDISTGGEGLGDYDPSGEGDDIDADKGKDKNKQIAEGDIKDLLLALQRVHFPFDVSTLTEPARNALTEAASKLEVLPEVKLYVEGHTDERGTTEYNMSLGERRAQAVVKYLTSLGIEEGRLNIISYGQESPLETGSSQLAHAKNRRVDFRLMQGDVEFVLEEGLLFDDEGNLIK